MEKNRICQLFGIETPIIQGGMVWCSGWRLASAVSNAGGLLFFFQKIQILNHIILSFISFLSGGFQFFMLGCMRLLQFLQLRFVFSS